MIQTLRLCFFIMITCTALQAQQYGVKGGLNVSDIAITNYINPDAESDYRMKAGLHAGVFATLQVADRFSISSELLYSNKGVKAADNINLHYVNLPLLALYHVTEDLFVEFGPEVGYLFSARSRFGNLSNTWNNKLDIGMDVGVRFKLSKMVAAGIRYNAGFSSVVDSLDESNSNYIPTEETIKYQNRVLQFSLYYQVGDLSIIRK